MRVHFFMLVLASLLLSFQGAMADGLALQWEKTFGGSDYDWGWSVQQTSDGGYVIAGLTDSFGAGSDDVYLIKTDSAGNLLWQKTFGGSNYDRGYSVQQTIDSGYIIAGSTKSFGAGSYDVYLVKTDPYGNIQWQKTFGGSGYDRGWSVQQTSDGGYIIAGETYSFGAGGYDVYLIKTDPYGNSQWQKTFGGSGYDYGFSVQRTTDGGYIIAGETTSFDGGGYDVYLIRTDSAGKLLWQKTFNGGDHDGAYSVQQTTDGGYILAGGTLSFGAGGGDVYLIRTDSAGNLLWEKTIGGSEADEGWSVQQTTDGGYIIAGLTKSFGAGSYDVYLIKLGLVQTVEIDIKPGSYPNAVNLGSHGLTLVAIFSEVGFDARSVDPATVNLSGALVARRGKAGDKFMAHEEDVNQDGMVDLVVQIVTMDIDLSLLEEENSVIYAVLSGNTYDGEAIEGEDEITLVPPEE